MAASAVHLVDEPIPRVPMRQWMLGMPKRLIPALRSSNTSVTRSERRADPRPALERIATALG